MKLFVKLLSYLLHYKPYLFLTIISNIFLSVFTVFSIPLIIPFFQILFDQQKDKSLLSNPSGLEEYIRFYFHNMVVQHGQEKTLLVVCLMIVIVFFLKNLSRYLALFFIAPVRNGIARDIRQQLFEKYLELPISFHTDRQKGDLISRCLSDVQELEWSILNFIEVIFKAPLIMLGSVVFMIYISPQLSIFVLLLMLFTVFVIGGISRSLKKESSEVQSSLGNLSSLIEEGLSGIRILKAFNATDHQNHKFKERNNYYMNLLNRLMWRRDLSMPMSEFLGVTVVACLLYYGSFLVFQSELYPETFFAFIFAFYQVIEPSKYFSSAYYNVQKGLAAFDRINVVLSERDTINIKENAHVLDGFNNIISFENVSFKYSDAENYALQHISFQLNKSETLAIVGHSGAGKSTLIDLLLRFRDVTEGSIKIDGVDIRDCDIISLRRLFGFVSQDSILFNDSITNNILLGRNYSMEAVINAAQIANAYDFIISTQEAFDYIVGDRGVKLSGGQRQRLTIARAIIGSPAIMLMDEATSALDSESELLIQEAVKNLRKDKTFIIIAHRLSTVKNADKILVLNEGIIDGYGSHQELMKTCDIYKKMIKLQQFS